MEKQKRTRIDYLAQKIAIVCGMWYCNKHTMPDQKLLEYIQQAKATGQSQEEIKATLANAGWKESDTADAFSVVFPKAATSIIKPKRRRWKKAILITGAVSAAIFSVPFWLPGMLGLFVKDIPSVDDQDLQLKNVILPPEEQNAYYDLVKIEPDITEPKDILDYLSGKKWDDDIIKDALAKNESFLLYFDAASKKEKFQDPAFIDPSKISFDTELVPMNTWRRVARLSALKALYLTKQGKDKEAMDEAFKSVQIGQEIQNSQASGVSYLVAIAMKNIGLEAIRRINTSSKLDSIELKTYTQGLSAYKNNDWFINFFKVEYHNQSQFTDLIASGDERALSSPFGNDIKKIKNNFYFQHNKTKAILAEFARLRIHDAEKPCGYIKKQEIKKLSLIKSFFTENVSGKIFYDVATAGLDSVVYKKCKEELLVSADQVLFALKAYSIDNGSLPASLDVLVPKYLPEVPTDPYDGKSLRYSAEKKIIYSVGEDGIDAGGSTGDDWTRMPDPTFSVQF